MLRLFRENNSTYPYYTYLIYSLIDYIDVNKRYAYMDNYIDNISNLQSTNVGCWRLQNEKQKA